MSGRDNAVRVALAAIALPVEDRVIVIDALLGLGDHFERALADNPDLQVVRPLSEILADIEFGVPLQPDETAWLSAWRSAFHHGRRGRSWTSATI